MFGHLMLGTNDLEVSKKFYDAVLGTLDIGGLWAKLSGGTCHFVMFTNKQWRDVDAFLPALAA